MAEDPRSVAAGRRTQIAKLLEGWEPAGRVLVDGRWNDPRSGQLRDAVDPATGETLIRAADGSEADVDAAVAAAERTREAPSWAMASPFERARVLRRIAAAVAEQSETLALLESADTGKPLDNAKGDVESAAACFD
ncbi:MAG: aldehyde dehydrogenase family protein, partial [Solirubrobacterales bacterium]